MFGSKRKRIEELEGKNRFLEEQVRKATFRVGDHVWIIKKGDTPSQVFLRESYNGGECYYWTPKQDDQIIPNDISRGVNVSRLSHSKPVACRCCGGSGFDIV